MFPNEAVELVMIALIALTIVVPFWKIFSKAGFRGWLSLSLIVPVLNLIVLYYLAFAEWPALPSVPRSEPGRGHP